MALPTPESWHAALHRLQCDGEPHALATLVTRVGSTPREPGARMVITATESHDTLGGGTFEWQILDLARQRLARRETGMSLEAFPLGGRSGQCCGGFANVLIEVFPGRRTTLALFGAGHVGREVVRLVAPLGWHVRWHDSRPSAFVDVPMDTAGLDCHHVTEPADAVAALPAGVHALVMTHDHAEDRSLVDALLRRDDIASIGLIGSRSKWASFRRRLAAAGHDEATLARVRCPLGAATGGRDKRPYAIALAAVAELLALADADEDAASRGLDPDALRRLFG